MGNEERQQEEMSTAPVIMAQEQAAIKSQFEMALVRPRNELDIVKSIEEIVLASEELAVECFYHLPPRGGKEIDLGASVRLAEIFMSKWRNLNVGTRLVDVGQTHVIVQGIAHDIETNTRYMADVTRQITGLK